MLQYALVCFLAALIAALFGFTGVAESIAGLAKALFVVFMFAAAVIVAAEAQRH
jgi:uncharacterized membrane protein YtjA (UPF0391 family)